MAKTFCVKNVIKYLPQIIANLQKNMEFVKIFIANEGARFFTNKTIAAKKFCAHQARKREVGIPPWRKK